MKKVYHTIGYWIKRMPEEYRDKAMNNTLNEYGQKGLKDKRESMADALLTAFTWMGSPEGSDYWDTRHDELVLANL